MSLDHPNILLITTDQQRTDTLSCYGSTFTHTPHLDALAAEGVCCERAYTTNPVCTPARISLFTGLQVSCHGAWNVGLNAPEETRTVANRLADEGYRTHNIGKMHFQAFGSRADQSLESLSRWSGKDPVFSGPYYGFQTVEFALGHTTYGLRGHFGAWVRSHVSEEIFRTFEKATPISESFGGEAYDWDLPLRFHNSVWTADRAIHFLKEQERSQPFFLSLGFQDPHHPHCLPLSVEESEGGNGRQEGTKRRRLMSEEQLTILLAGDHPEGFESLLSYLQGEGFKIVPVENRDSIVTMTRSTIPDLILLDLKSCFDICRLLKRNFVTGPIPIIALLSQADEIDRIVVLELGADDCLGKPYNFRELNLRIRASLIRAWERKGKVRYDQAKHYAALFRSLSSGDQRKNEA